MSNILQLKLKNVTNGKKHITGIISKLSDNDKVANVEVLELLQDHPTKHIDIENIDYLFVKIRPPHNKLALFYKYKNSETVDDISYTLCIKALFGKYNKDEHYEKDVMTAFRNESHIGSKNQYFINHTTIKNNVFHGICDHCKIETSNITTDHFPIPYKQIFADFVNQNNIILSNIEVFENGMNEIRIKDEELAGKFRKFHDDNANYRLLCKPCNSHFGSYEH